MKKYEYFRKALSNLHEGAQLRKPYTVVEKAGIIALFERCFDASWKLMKVVLQEEGRFGISDRKIGSLREIIKIAYQCGMMDDMEG